MYLPELLVNYRKKNKLTQKEVGASLGITRQYYAMLEEGHREPPPTMVDKISKLLGERIIWIFPSDDPINREFMEDKLSYYPQGFPIPIVPSANGKSTKSKSSQ